MADTREIKRKLERDIEKGRSTPLRFVGIKFPDHAYGGIASMEQLNAQLDLFLRLEDFKPADDRGCINNAYFHRGLLKNELSCTRCHNEMQRKECKFKTINYNRAKGLDFSKVVCEKILCEFYLDDMALEKCRCKYNGRDTYAFLLSHTYLANTYELCRRSRLTAVADGVDYTHLPEADRKHATFEDVKTGIFQALMLRSYGHRSFSKI